MPTLTIDTDSDPGAYAEALLFPSSIRIIDGPGRAAVDPAEVSPPVASAGDFATSRTGDDVAGSARMKRARAVGSTSVFPPSHDGSNTPEAQSDHA